MWTGWSHTCRVWDVKFTPLGLVSSGEDGSAKVWDLSTPTVKGELRGHLSKSIWRVASTPPGSSSPPLVVTGGNDGCAKIYDLKYHCKFNRPHPHEFDFDATLTFPEKPVDEGGKSKKKEKFVVHSNYTLPSHPSTTIAITTCGSIFATSSKKSPPTLTHLPLPSPRTDGDRTTQWTATSSAVHPKKPCENVYATFQNPCHPITSPNVPSVFASLRPACSTCRRFRNRSHKNNLLNLLPPLNPHHPPNPRPPLCPPPSFHPYSPQRLHPVNGPC